jgi:cell division septation protein DedD
MRAARRINCRAWTVQAGVFGKKAGANKVVEELRAKKLAATVEPLLGREKLVFIVQVGRHEAYEQAIKTLKGVRQHVDDAFVVPTKR